MPGLATYSPGHLVERREQGLLQVRECTENAQGVESSPWVFPGVLAFGRNAYESWGLAWVGRGISPPPVVAALSTHHLFVRQSNIC